MSAGSPGLRTFVAAALPPVAEQALENLQNRLRPLNLHARWVPPGNIHLTLKFLGEIDPARLPEIRDALGPPLSSLPGIPVTLGPPGAFPNARNPRVLWVGVDGPEGALVRLQEVVESALAPLGFAPEGRKFSPHLTLARIKSLKNIALLKPALDALPPAPPVKFDISALTLYKSQLTPAGSIYTVLENFGLGD